MQSTGQSQPSASRQSIHKEAFGAVFFLQLVSPDSSQQALANQPLRESKDALKIRDCQGLVTSLLA